MTPNDEIVDTLPEYSEERSSTLIEPIEKVNIGTKVDPKIIHLAKSFTLEERGEFIYLFKQKKINFAWLYANMLELDPNLILHHLNITLGAKLIKENLRKMHPRIELLVKIELEKLL